MMRKSVDKSRMDDVAIEYEAIGGEEDMRRITSIHEAPEYLRHNPYILRGYRACRTKKLCIQSMFWWTNETINIWSHLFGFFYFVGLIIDDLFIKNVEVTDEDKRICLSGAAVVLVTLLISSFYHTFSCKSEKAFHWLLTLDLLGISCTIMVIFLTGIHFAFFCYPIHRMLYLIIYLFVFITTLLLQVSIFKVRDTALKILLCGWALSGVLPTIHGVIVMGLQHPMVQELFPRIIGMYVILISAFLVYHYQVPESLFPGFFDHIGSSHQLWHFLIVIALNYWHNTLLMYLDYKYFYGCVVLS